MERLLRALAEEVDVEKEDEVTDCLKFPDTSEKVMIRSLAIIKMLKHCRAGVPFEVMGLLLGNFIDDFTIEIVDVFALPQKATTVSVESIDPVYQSEMIEKLQQVGRKEMIVGWYHSHPGFGCWLSSIDINTQQSFEALHPRAIAIVIDPIQSVKGKVLIEAYRSIKEDLRISTNTLAPTASYRQCTSNLLASSMASSANGLGTKYYAIIIDYRIAPNEEITLCTIKQRNRTTPMTFEPIAHSNLRRYNHMNEINEQILEIHKQYESEQKDDNNKNKTIKMLTQKLEENSQEMMSDLIEFQLKLNINRYNGN